MKNRICLAWFCDLDAPDQRPRKTRPVTSREIPAREAAAVTRRPELKETGEPRRLSGQR